ncbi:MAG: Holliday junction resolvase RuvX [Anaerolineae bacterium]|jgi:putative holliday junction resolvase
MKLMALDVGERRVGVAVSDTTGVLATPLMVVRRKSKVEDFYTFARLVREQGVEGLVIGHPLNADGNAGPQARRVERYAAALLEALSAEGLTLQMFLWDEHMSTQRAQQLMIEAGRKARERRGRIDAVAAAVILQDYLDEQRQLGETDQSGPLPS